VVNILSFSIRKMYYKNYIQQVLLSVNEVIAMGKKIQLQNQSLPLVDIVYFLLTCYFLL
jgi:hypothetical protein